MHMTTKKSVCNQVCKYQQCFENQHMALVVCYSVFRILKAPAILCFRDFKIQSKVTDVCNL
jgi:hypothetical protein